ncbi:MAG TPA: hypothetical protein VM345_05950 [Acidimicrobiales bacterium]|jgi:hypothetical protein|nr:hypothetical protein [Acidimicrobiales bacterium]
MTSTRSRSILAALLVTLGLLGAACSAEGDVNTEGDGVEINGDIDSTEE